MAEAGAHHDAHGHHPSLQHHFDTPEQQFESGKLGMWLFLATEILLFGGLFVAYAVYRGNHPEIFDFGHRFLDKKMGAMNTVILLTSSLTMAWGVRAAQLGQQRLLKVLLSLTLLGGAGFMVIKFFEYREKFEHHLLWGMRYESPLHHGEQDAAAAHGGEATAAAEPVAETEAAAADPAQGVLATTPAGVKIERSTNPAPAAGPEGLAVAESEAEAAGHASGPEPRNVQIFFGIYFLMTGLHGLHVLVGMIAIGWVLLKAARGVFGPQYFTPVDLVGLYWHLVDLIWIFLFPLFYLIV